MTDTPTRPDLTVIAGARSGELSKEEIAEIYLLEVIAEYVEDWIERVREFALECDDSVFARARQKYNSVSERQLPAGLERAFAQIDDITGNAYSRYKANGSWYGVVRTQDTAFCGNVKSDVVRFLPEFKEAIVDFVTYSELFLENGPSFGVAFDGDKFLAFENLGWELQKEVTQELYAQGLKLLAAIRKENYSVGADLLGRNSAVLFWHPDELDAVFEIAEEVNSTEPKTPDASISKSEIGTLIASDPKRGYERAISRLIRSDSPQVDRESSVEVHPSNGVASPVREFTLILSRDLTE